MGKKDRAGGRMELTRRDFLKVAGAGAAAAAAVGPLMPAPAAAYTLDAADVTAGGVDKFHTTCAYCSAQCGQVVHVGKATKKVYDIHGDPASPINNGGLCAKGAGAFQLVNNPRRLGAWPGSHPVNSVFAYDSSGTYADGIAYKRTGDGAWSKMPLQNALNELAPKLLDARQIDSAGWNPGADKYTSHSVAFFGCSHISNECNYLYRKIIANFGTQNTEHQARI